MTNTSGPLFLQDLSTFLEASPEITGGKGAGLFQLIRHGFRVPPAWVVPTTVYSTFLITIGLQGELAALEKRLGSEPPIKDLEAIREKILNWPLPEGLLAQIRQLETQWADLFGSQIIMRSSATVEDQAHHSFAGIFESIACETEQEIETALRRVWASVFSPRAFSYYGIASLDRFPAMAVILQPFVQADRSGVMFTEFSGPRGEPQILVEYVAGSGDKLVTGQVNPERFWMPRWPGMEEVEPQKIGSISVDSVQELARIARELEDGLGQPQDVEWCVLDETLYILQSRPITAGIAPSPPSSGGEILLQGVGASPGHAGGPVHLVFNIEDAFALQAGQVLTTTMTNPDMVPMMQRSSAVVTDVGGMICHAAIISRELGLPCVVGTKTATQTLEDGALVTVDGSAGLIYQGQRHSPGDAESRRPLQWSDLWQTWQAVVPSQALPLITTLDALIDIPDEINTCVLDPYCDLTLDPLVEISPLAATKEALRRQLLDGFLSRLSTAAGQAGLEQIYLDLHRLEPDFQDQIAHRLPPAGNFLPLRKDRSLGPWEISRTPDGREMALLEGYATDALDAAPGDLPLAVPLGFGLLLNQAQVAPPDHTRDSPEGIFGMMPGVVLARMPPAATREPMHQLIPALAAAHGNHPSAPDQEYPWLDLRPEVIITPLLKSLVTPGVEIIPPALNFDGPPLFIQFIRCRFHFRQDTLFNFFPKLIQSTWDEPFLAVMLQRCRASYEALEARSRNLPGGENDPAAMEDELFFERVVAWWRAFTEFFSLSFFIQAQGDDGIFPQLAALAAANTSLVEDAYPEWSFPGPVDLSAPVTPVLTAEYMQDLLALKETLHARGLESLFEAERTLDMRQDPEINAAFDRVLERWYWMRERDLYYDPYDTAPAILKQAISVRRMDPPDYQGNRANAALALAIHFDLGRVADNSEKIVYAVKYGRALALDRENHHIVWLRASYRLRKLLVALERQLAEINEMQTRDIFFMQIWEILEAAAAFPQPLPEEMLARIRNRRAAYEKEIQLKAGVESDLIPIPEADYY